MNAEWLQITGIFKYKHTSERIKCVWGLKKQQIHRVISFSIYRAGHLNCKQESLNKLCFKGSGVLLSCRLFQVSFPQQDGDSARDKHFRASQASAPKQWTAGNLKTHLLFSSKDISSWSKSLVQTAFPHCCWNRRWGRRVKKWLLYSNCDINTGLLLVYNVQGFTGCKSY